MGRFHVLVVGEAVKSFDTPYAAVQYASSRVYLSWERQDEALRTLESGAEFRYSYGFKEVSIVPVAS